MSLELSSLEFSSMDSENLGSDSEVFDDAEEAEEDDEYERMAELLPSTQDEMPVAVQQYAVEDDYEFADVQELLQKYDLPQATPEMLRGMKANANFITLSLDEHRKVRINRARGIMMAQAGHVTQPLPLQGALPLEVLLSEGGIKNHADLATLIVNDARQEVAIDHEGSWRLFDAGKGTWALQETQFAVSRRLRALLVDRIKLLVEDCERRSALWPALVRRAAAPADEAIEDSKVPSLHQAGCAWVTKLRGLIDSSGSTVWMSHFTQQFQGLLRVDRALWESHFRGYLPLADALVHFSVESGECAPLEYRAHHYVRQEYQCDIKYPTEEQEETLANQAIRESVDAMLRDWWGTREEQQAWMESIVYALSRSAFQEKMFVVEGPPSSAKSTVMSKIVKRLFGDGNVHVHANAGLLCRNPRARMNDDNGKGHDSASLVCYDKALVIFNEPEAGYVFRQGRVKEMSGDPPSGRAAHSADTETFERSFTIFVVCNKAPLLEDAQDDAMHRRIHFLTSSNVFYTDEEHRKRIEQRMSNKQRAEAVWKHADSRVIDAFLREPQAHTYFFQLLMQAWSTLIERRDGFLLTEDARRVYNAYWAEQRAGDDPVARFAQSQLRLCDHPQAAIPTKDMLKAYTAWSVADSALNGSDAGAQVASRAFQKRLLQYFRGVKPAVAIKQRPQGSKGLRPRCYLHLCFFEPRFWKYNWWAFDDVKTWMMVASRKNLRRLVALQVGYSLIQA